MLVYTPFALCFVTFHGFFYAFSGTNLLTRCHSASSLFSVFTEAKAEPPIFTEASRRPEMTQRGASGQPHHQGAWPSPWPRPPMVRLPGRPPDAAPSPISSPRWEKPKGRISFSWNILQAAAVAIARSGGSRSSSRHPAEEGNPYRRPSTPPWSPPEWCVSSLPWTMGP
jgi:hypothetical protein